ncbi:hypothetical protein V8V91_23125 [Algoriphagus halophilus]|uniref:hypothetical protein n=1 Tax=Algoriphagus halophilus TaxID=226505 RepID=UPI00358F2707
MPHVFQFGRTGCNQISLCKSWFYQYQHPKIEVNLPYSSDEEACQASFMGGPVAMAYSRFDEQTKEEAQKEYIESIQPYKTATGYDIPGEFVVAIGIKPPSD